MNERLGVWAFVAVLACHLVARAADDVPMDLDRLLKDAKAQHKNLVDEFRDDVKILERLLKRARGGRIDKKLDDESFAPPDLKLPLVFKTAAAKTEFIRRLSAKLKEDRDKLVSAEKARIRLMPFLLSPFSIGQIGRMGSFFGDSATAEVVQVVDETSAIMKITFRDEDGGLSRDNLVWVTVSTDGLTDGATVDFEDRVLQYTGTRAYVNALGARTTVKSLRQLDDEQVAKANAALSE